VSLLLYRTPNGPMVTVDGNWFDISAPSWDELLNTAKLALHLRSQTAHAKPVAAPAELLAPIEGQEVWGAGVTYFRSRVARKEESKEAGGGDFYDRVYNAPRPELFFKATALRVVPPGGALRIRSDSRWVVPEPELTLVVNKRGSIIGYTIGNDLSCRDIEGENPLYLPQAKTFDGCAAIGPGLLIQDQPLPGHTRIQLQVLRAGEVQVDDGTELSLMKRDPAELVAFLTREARFPAGCFLMTGTGIVPDEGFTLEPGDEVRITIDPIGTLVNFMTNSPPDTSLE
jgi:2-dehydro-3-deoxy-D-arabinonate dehydratase